MLTRNLACTPGRTRQPGRYQPAALSRTKQGQSGQSQGLPLTHAQFGQHNCPQHPVSWAIAFTPIPEAFQNENTRGLRHVPRTSTLRTATLSPAG